MKLFISYGHDRTELVRRVAEELRERGHEVWMDLTDLKSGMDWRNEIARTITESQAVLVFLSAHALRKGGVCLDEISIAAACGKRLIRPILTEHGIESEIPAIVNGIQYFDFSDWEAMLDDENLWQRRLDPLLAELNAMGADPYERQMEAIQNVLRPCFLHAKLLKELEKPYCARMWLNALLIERINQAGNTPLLLIGFPGSGKSCFCSHFFQSTPSAVSLIYCEWGKSSYNNVKTVIRNIACQIAARVTSFRSRLLWLLSVNPVSLTTMSEYELFDQLIVEPFLYELGGDHEPLLIILDGVDEADSDGQNLLAGLIAEKYGALPDYVHFLLTSRNDPAVLCHYAGTDRLELRPDDIRVREDILGFLREQLETAPRHVSLERLADACEGSFLVAFLIAKGIRNGGIRVTSQQLIPENIYSIYHQWMGRLVQGAVFEQAYYEVFSILAAVSKPVSLELLRYAVGWKRGRMLSFVRKFRSFLLDETDTFGDRSLSLFHSSFREWMSDENAGRYYVDPEEGIEMLADRALTAYREQLLTDGEVLRLWDYLAQAGNAARLKALAEDDAYLDRIFGIADACAEQVDRYLAHEEATALCEKVCTARDGSARTEYYRSVRLPITKAYGLFCAGDYAGAADLLADHKDAIAAFGVPDEKMKALYILGTSQDLLGDRAGSLESFECLLDLAGRTGRGFYRKRALVGIAWNSHFSDMNRLEEVLQELAGIPVESETESAIHRLLAARALLSRGNLAQALEQFTSLMQTNAEDLWGYDLLAARNQMLMIEALVACYDNEAFDQGIWFGRIIYDRLAGSNSLAECYCASWIAMNCITDGLPEEARRYLEHADHINRESNSSLRSRWITMHLCSINAFYRAEIGDPKQALALHRQVASMAEACSDPWVLGDACFEILVLSLLNPGVVSLEEESSVQTAARLRQIASDSGLPHLRFKSCLVDCLLEGRADEDTLENLTGQIRENTLPSTDMVLAAFLCRRLALGQGHQKSAEELAAQIRRTVQKIAARNPLGRYRQRRLILQIEKELES